MRQHGDRCLGATPASLKVAWLVCLSSLKRDRRKLTARVLNGYSSIYIYIELHRDIAANIHVYIYMYIFICIYIYMYIYIYIYIYI